MASIQLHAKIPPRVCLPRVPPWLLHTPLPVHLLLVLLRKLLFILLQVPLQLRVLSLMGYVILLLHLLLQQRRLLLLLLLLLLLQLHIPGTGRAPCRGHLSPPSLRHVAQNTCLYRIFHALLFLHRYHLTFPPAAAASSPLPFSKRRMFPKYLLLYVRRVNLTLHQGATIAKSCGGGGRTVPAPA